VLLSLLLEVVWEAFEGVFPPALLSLPLSRPVMGPVALPPFLRETLHHCSVRNPFLFTTVFVRAVFIGTRKGLHPSPLVDVSPAVSYGLRLLRK